MSTPAFKTHIEGDAGLLSLLGRQDDGTACVFPNLIPQGMVEEGNPNLDCIVFRRVGTDRQALFCGTDSLVAGHFEFDCYSDDYDKAGKIADALRLRLLDFRGLMGDVKVGPVLLDTETEPQPEPVPGLHVESQVYTVWYQES